MVRGNTRRQVRPNSKWYPAPPVQRLGFSSFTGSRRGEVDVLGRGCHKLHDGLREAIGDENAGVLMTALPPFPWNEIALKSEIRALEESMEFRFDSLIATIDSTKVFIEGKLAGHEARFEVLDGKIEGIDGRIDALSGQIDALEGKMSLIVARVILADFALLVAFSAVLPGAMRLEI